MNFRIGLDIGIASVGWAILEDNERGEPIRIVKMGVRTFDIAEDGKTGASLAEVRRMKRSQRRRNRREIYRTKSVKKLILEEGFLNEEKLEKLYQGDLKDIHILRLEALERKLAKEELTRILLYFVKKRGYHFDSKSQEKLMSTGNTLKTISDNQELMERKQYRTVGEMYVKDDKFKYYLEDGTYLCDSQGKKIIKIRNENMRYKSTVSRKMLTEEIKLIFECQRQYGLEISDHLMESYLKIFQSQRSFDTGPSFPSKFGGNLIEKMLGTCTFEKNEKRAPKATYTFEIFKLLQDLNKIKIEKYKMIRGEDKRVWCMREGERNLSEKEKSNILKEFRKNSKIHFNQLREIIALPEYEIFNFVSYEWGRYDGDVSLNQWIYAKEKEYQLVEMENFHLMRKALDHYQKNYIRNLSEEVINEIAIILTLYKSDEIRRNYLLKLSLPNEAVEQLLTLTFSKVSHLSLKAMKKLIPYLLEGMTYDKAINSVYLSQEEVSEKEKRRKFSMELLKDIKNPVVKRGISQTLKVLNAIIKEYGVPEVIQIELAREVGKNYFERKEIEKKRKQEEERRIDLEKKIMEVFGLKKVSKNQRMKYELWLEQGGICPYSGEKIEQKDIFQCYLDYIIPYDKCFNDSITNLVLVKQIKKGEDKTYLGYLKLSTKDITSYQERINKIYEENLFKRRQLLKEEILEEDINTWKKKYIQDTQYITSKIVKLIREFLPSKENKNYQFSPKIFSVKGKITSQIRKGLDILKFREDDIHHAIDAAIVAIITDSMIKKITKYEQGREMIDEKFPLPYDNFLGEIYENLNDSQSWEKEPSIFVSRMPKHKVKGMAHKETISRISDEKKLVNRTKLTDLKLGKDGEIVGYYHKEDDSLLYEALKRRLTIYHGNATLAFQEPFYKPRSDGTRGPIVKKVKIQSSCRAYVPIPKVSGAAGNSNIVRIDVFYVAKEGYFFIPIYVADTVKSELPKRACLSYKSIENWKVMREEDFIFSLYPNDFISVKCQEKSKLKLRKLQDKNGEKIEVGEVFGYYLQCGISNASISILTHDRKYVQPSLGIRNLKELKKYQVDILGNLHEVKIPEKRMAFSISKK